MSRKRHTREQIINKLREAEVELANSATVAQVPWGRGRKHYNTVRPHNSLGYCPPAPEARQSWARARSRAPGLA